jgi:hypothetical protein
LREISTGHPADYQNSRNTPRVEKKGSPAERLGLFLHIKGKKEKGSRKR